MSSANNGTEQALQQFQNESQVPQQMVAYITCLIIAYAGVVLRFLCRRMKQTSLEIDDWLILVSLFFTTAFAGINISLTRDGLGRHERFITNAEFFALGILIAQVLYGLSLFVVKMSMLFLLRRIFPTKRLYYALWITGSVITVYTTVQIVCLVVHCIPFTALWDPTVSAHCINTDPVIVVCSSFNMATDVAILIMPMPELWNLQITTRQKLQITFLFLLGGLVCIFSVVRITKLQALSLSDPGWTAVPSAIWSVVECCIATLSACLPIMRPLFDWLFGNKHHDAAKGTPRNSAGYESSVSGRRRRTAFREDQATYIDTWPLRTPTDFPITYVSLEVNSIRKT